MIALAEAILQGDAPGLLEEHDNDEGDAGEGEDDSGPLAIPRGVPVFPGGLLEQVVQGNHDLNRMAQQVNWLTNNPRFGVQAQVG